jgi:hypothetical protein
MSKRIVQATFSTGNSIKRGSKDRTYTYAYLVTIKTADGTVVGWSGFSSSESQCWDNLRSESARVRKEPGAVVMVEEVVPVVVLQERKGRA